MPVTTYKLVTAKTPEALNSAVAAEIADSKQPLGAPFVLLAADATNTLCPAVIGGSPDVTSLAAE